MYVCIKFVYNFGFPPQCLRHGYGLVLKYSIQVKLKYFTPLLCRRCFGGLGGSCWSSRGSVEEEKEVEEEMDGGWSSRALMKEEVEEEMGGGWSSRGSVEEA